MISHELQCIFVHIGKTGGSSIEHLLDPTIKTSDKNTNSHTKKLWRSEQRAKSLGNTQIEGKHTTAVQYKKQYPEEFDRYFKFSVVRNPWDRMVSALEWHRFVFANPHMTLTEVINKYSRNKLTGFSHNYLLDDKGEVLVDAVLRFENLREEILPIQQRLGITDRQLPHHNNLRRRVHYSHYYTPKQVELVRKQASWVIDRYGYVFEDNPPTS